MNSRWTAGERLRRLRERCGVKPKLLKSGILPLGSGLVMDFGENLNKEQRFGEFAVDARAGELYRRGKKVKVQLQPMQVLIALLEKPGKVVTREELRQRIWPADTFVDFEHGLNTAIKKLRQALGDRATRSKFVETLPKRGYRFLPTVSVDEGPTSVKRGPTGSGAGKVFSVEEQETECVLAPTDPKSLEEWQRLTRLGDDVGVSMMITEKRLLLLARGQVVRLLSGDCPAGWCEVRILDGEHYGRAALVPRKTLKDAAARTK
jgi:DNA-binding winged helix-turn-helix (wHTH) protein